MKEYTLFDMEGHTPEKHLILYEPDKEKMARWRNVLNEYTVPDLQLLADPLLDLVTKKKFQIQTLNTSIKETSSVFSILTRKTTKLKADWLQLAAFFLADSRNMVHYVQTLSEEDVLGWKLIIKNLYANNSTLKEATGKDWIADRNPYSYYYGFSPAKGNGWFSFTTSKSGKISRYGFREKDAYLFLSSDFSKLFAPIFFPEIDFILYSHKELPSQGLFTFNGEADFLRCFPIMQALYKQGILTMGKNKMLATTIKKANKQTSLTEFFEGNIPNELSGIRASIVLPAITMLFDHTQKQKDKKAEDLLKELFGYLLTHYFNFAQLLLPDINGIKSSKLFESTIGELILDAKWAITITPQGWISVDDIENHLLVHPTGGQNSLQVFKTYQLDGMDLFNKTTGEFVHLGNLKEHLGIPFLKGFYFLLGGLGMLELAYEYPSEVSSSVFNTLKYIRLTELGKYALGLESVYTPPAIEKKKLFHLDNERLLIRSLVEDNPYESLLQDTAIPIGNHRFIMNSDSFLKNCKTEKDVNDKIDFFKQFISQEDAPEIWTSFFEQMLKQCHPLKKMRRENYVIYQLDGNNKELIRLLTTDSVLKSIIIRAEGYIILVEVKNQRKLIDRLKTYGYLL